MTTTTPYDGLRFSASYRGQYSSRSPYAWRSGETVSDCRADSTDPGIVAAIGENESHIGIRKSLDLINGPPGCDMVRQSADGKDGDPDIPQRDGPAADREVPFGQLVIEEQPAQIGRMHAVRHPESLSAFQAIRSNMGSRSPIRYSCIIRDQMRSLERSS